MLGESAYQLAQLSDIKNITAASSSILRIFLDSAYVQETSIRKGITKIMHIPSILVVTP